MESQVKDLEKLTLSEYQAQERRAIQPYGARCLTAMAAAGVLLCLGVWLDFPHSIACFTLAIPLWIVASRNAAKAREIKSRRAAEQKEAMERHWREEDEQLFK